MLNQDQLNICRAVHKKVLSVFEYEEDKTVWNMPEHWEDEAYIAQQIHDGKIVGDCDNFALACRYLLGHLPTEIPNRLVMCHDENGDGHLVCEASGYILDNRQTEVKAWGDLPYKWLKISGYHAGDPWHEIGK